MFEPGFGPSTRTYGHPALDTVAAKVTFCMDVNATYVGWLPGAAWFRLPATGFAGREIPLTPANTYTTIDSQLHLHCLTPVHLVPVCHR